MVFSQARVAEELIYSEDEITTGASNDLEQVTSIARRMVMRWGMSPKLGPIAYGRKDELVFLGREISEQRDFSENVAHEIDAEVRRLVTEAHDTAKAIVEKWRAKLDETANYLLENETLEMDQFEALWKGEPIPVRVIEAKPPEVPPVAPPTETPNTRPAAGASPMPLPAGA